MNHLLSILNLVKVAFRVTSDLLIYRHKSRSLSSCYGIIRLRDHYHEERLGYASIDLHLDRKAPDYLKQIN